MFCCYSSQCIGNFPVFVIARSLRRGNPDRNMTINAKRLDCFAAARNDGAFGVPMNSNVLLLLPHGTNELAIASYPCLVYNIVNK